MEGRLSRGCKAFPHLLAFEKMGPRVCVRQHFLCVCKSPPSCAVLQARAFFTLNRQTLPPDQASDSGELPAQNEMREAGPLTSQPLPSPPLAPLPPQSTSACVSWSQGGLWTAPSYPHVHPIGSCLYRKMSKYLSARTACSGSGTKKQLSDVLFSYLFIPPFY